MDREGYLDTLRKHYTDEIHEAYVLSEHGTKVDYQQLKRALAKLRRNAEVEGLPPREFDELVLGELGHVSDQLSLESVEKAAA